MTNDEKAVKELLARTHPGRRWRTVCNELRDRLILAGPAGAWFVYEEETGYYLACHTKAMIPKLLKEKSPTIMACALNSHATRSPQALVDAFGHTVDDICWRPGLSGTTYDAVNGTVSLPCWERDESLEPKYDSRIEKWLKFFAADHYENLADYLATVTDVEGPTRLLYLYGPTKAGKNLLVKGLAKLWTFGDAIEYEGTTDRFNEDFVKTPLIFLDEGLSKSAHSAHVRRLVTSDRHEVKRKFRDKSFVDGHVRVIVASNNLNALQVKEKLEKRDVEALEDRIGLIEASAKAVDYLKHLQEKHHERRKVKGEERFSRYTDRWVKGKKIAQFALWLKETREVHGDGRFVCSSWDHPARTSMLGRMNESGRDLLEILALAYTREAAKRFMVIDDEDGRLYTHASGLREFWTKAWKKRDVSFPVPAQSVMIESFKALGACVDRKRFQGVQKRAWGLPKSQVEAFSRESDYLESEDDREEIRKRLKLKKPKKRRRKSKRKSRLSAEEFENARPATDEEWEAHLDRKYAEMESGEER